MNEDEKRDSRDQRSMRSAIDSWIAVILGISALVCLWAASVLLLSNSIVGWVAGIATLLLGAGLPIWMMLHTVYRLEDDHLVAESGPFRWRVAYRDVRSITRRRELLAGPALSMDRLVIDYGPMRCLIISPRNPEAFKSALQRRVDPPH